MCLYEHNAHAWSFPAACTCDQFHFYVAFCNFPFGYVSSRRIFIYFIHFFSGMFFFNQSQPWVLWTKKLYFYPSAVVFKNVSWEYDRLNGWNSTLQAVWYIRHVRWACLFYISFIVWCLWSKPTIWLLILSFTIFTEGRKIFKKRKEKKKHVWYVRVIRVHIHIYSTYAIYYDTTLYNIIAVLLHVVGTQEAYIQYTAVRVHVRVCTYPLRMILYKLCNNKQQQQ